MKEKVKKDTSITIDTLLKKGWSKKEAMYLKEMFDAIDIQNNDTYKGSIDEIIDNENHDSIFIGFYDEDYFDTYLAYQICDYRFIELKSGVFDKGHAFYKTNDDQYVIEIQM